MCEVCLIEQRDARLAFVPCGHQRFCASCVAHLNNRRAGAPSAGQRLPWFCIVISLTVITWAIISWCWLSVTFFLHLHKLCSQLCCQLCCTNYIFIIQLYSSYIWYLKNNNRQNVTPALKDRFRHRLYAKHNTAFLYNIGRAGRK